MREKHRFPSLCAQLGLNQQTFCCIRRRSLRQTEPPGQGRNEYFLRGTNWKWIQHNCTSDPGSGNKKFKKPVQALHFKGACWGNPENRWKKVRLLRHEEKHPRNTERCWPRRTGDWSRLSGYKSHWGIRALVRGWRRKVPTRTTDAFATPRTCWLHVQAKSGGEHGI